MKHIWLILFFLWSNVGLRGQSTKQNLQVTVIPGINSAWAGEGSGCPGTVDNRSTVSRRNWYHSAIASGTGSWTVTIRHSNTSCTGPWTAYASTAAITQASNPAVAFALDVYSAPSSFINILITGNAVVTYSAESQLPLSTAAGSVSFPISVAQGGTGVVAAQGVGDTKVQLAGTNSGTSGDPLCNDANGGVTTSGCTPVLPSGTQTQYLRIKPNVGVSTTVQFADLPTFNSADYSFPVASPSGTLSAGVAATVTLTICPLGVFGSHTSANHLPHNLRVATVGTPEAVTITGGTCTGTGLAGGTVIFTPANAHSAGWTLGPASSGIQEAIYMAGASAIGVDGRPTGAVRIPAGTINLYGGFTVPDGYSTSVRGAGMYTTILSTQETTGDWITYDWYNQGGHIDLGDFTIQNSNPAVNHTSGAMVKVRYRSYMGVVSNLYANNCWDCFWVEGNQGTTYVNNGGSGSHYTFYATCAGVGTSGGCVNLFNVLGGIYTAGGDGYNTFRIEAPTGGIKMTGVFISGGPFDSTNIAVNLVSITGQPLNEIDIVGCTIDGHATGVSYSGDGVGYVGNSVMLRDSRITSSHTTIACGNYCQRFSIIGNIIGAFGSAGTDRGIVIGGNAHDVTIENNAQINTDGDRGIVLQGADLVRIKIKDNVFGVNAAPSFACIDQNGTVTDLEVTGNDLTNCGSNAYSAGGTMSGKIIIQDNAGLDTDSSKTIASASSIPLGWYPFYTILGTTSIATITGGWDGREEVFQFTDAAPATLTFSTAGNIATAVTLSQNQSARCRYNGTTTKWMCTGPPAPPTDGSFFVPPQSCVAAVTGTAGAGNNTIIVDGSVPALKASSTAAASSNALFTCTFQVPPSRVLTGRGAVLADITYLYGVQTTSATSMVASTFKSFTAPAAGTSETASSATLVAAGGSLTQTPVIGSANLTAITAGQYYSEKVAFGTPEQITTDLKTYVLTFQINQSASAAQIVTCPGFWVHYTQPSIN